MRQTPLRAINRYRAQATLGEGPLWDGREQVLWWVDIEEGRLFRFDPATDTNEQFEIGQRIGTVVLRETGGVLIAVENGFATYDTSSTTLDFICDPEAGLTENRFNDGKCDPAGRLWAGTMNLDPGRHSTGALYSIDGQRHVKKHLSGVGVSNGVVWSADTKSMYYIDSMIGLIEAFDFDCDRGIISNRRPVFKVPSDLGAADGMAIDSQDRLWVAFWGGGCVGCVDPGLGKLVETIPVPVGQPTACAFGGSDYCELYITSARHGLSDSSLSKQPEAGDIFTSRMKVPGVPSARYNG